MSGEEATVAVEWKNDNRPRGFGSGGVEVPPDPVPSRDRNGGRSWSRLGWWFPTIWSVILLFVALAAVFGSLTIAGQNRIIDGMLKRLSVTESYEDKLGKVVEDLRARVEVLERGAKTVPTTSIKPEKFEINSSGGQVPIPASASVSNQRVVVAPDPATRKEVEELKAAMQTQGEKLDAVLDGLRNAEGSRRHRR